MSPRVPFEASAGGAVVPAATTPLTPQAPRLALAPRTRRAIWARPRPLPPSLRGRRRPPLPPVRARAGGRGGGGRRLVFGRGEDLELGSIVGRAGRRGRRRGGGRWGRLRLRSRG